MTENVAKKAVEWALANSEHYEFHLGFFGGDPLLNIDIIKPTIDHTEKLLETHKTVKRCWYTVFVNGYNKNLKKMIDIVKPYGRDKVYIQFSMDGCKEAQDAGRPAAHGKSVFNEVVKSLKLVKKELGYVSIHAVISPDTIKYLNKSVDFMFKAGCKNIELAMCRDAGWTEEARETFDREIHKLADRYIAWMKKGKNSAISLFLSPIHAIIKNKKSSCYIGKTGVLIGHDGAIYPCQRMEKYGEKYMMGDVFNGINENSEKMWSIVDYEHMPQCIICPLYKMCVGTCAGANIDHHGNPFKPIKETCMVYKTLYKESIRIYKECKDLKCYHIHMERVGVHFPHREAH